MIPRLQAALRAHAPAALALLGAVCVALWPLPRLLGGDTALGHEVGDLADHYWGTWWFGSELLAGRWPSSTDLVQYPGEVKLWYVDPLGALLALLLRPAGFPAAWNGLVLLQAWLGALGAYAVATRLSGSRAAGALAGVLVGCSPYLIGLAHSGLSEYLGLLFPVLFTGALISAMGLDPDGRAPGRWTAPAAGLLLAGCALQAFYYAAFGALLTGLAVLGPGWRARLAVAVKIGLVFGVVAAPLFLVAWSTLTSPEAAVTTDNAPGWSYKALPATDLLTFVRPGEYYFPDTRAENPGILHVNYLGWVGLALAAAALLRRGEGSPGARALLPLTLGYALMTLGPRLCVGGQLVTWGGGAVPLPLALLYVPGSPFRFVHHPYRMVAFLIPLVALLAALAARRLPRPAIAGLAALALVESVAVSPAPWPLASAEVRAPAVYAALPAGPVLDWPPDATLWNRRYALWQVGHGRPIAYGVNTFLPEDLLRDPLIQQLLGALQNPTARARNRDVPASGRVIVPAKPGPTTLGELGFRALVLHEDALGATERQRARSILVRQLGPLEEIDGRPVWRLGEGR